jgi:hypothetical protein
MFSKINVLDWLLNFLGGIDGCSLFVYQACIAMAKEKDENISFTSVAFVVSNGLILQGGK